MTDFLESVLSSMSSAFNSSPTPADGTSVIDLNLNDDKTLKWRSLLNNSNALKSGKKSNLSVEQQQQQPQQQPQQQQQQNQKHHQHHQHQQQQQQQQQQGTFINNININNITNNNQREEEGENKMSQGQDNISYTSSNTNSSNEITNSNNNNNNNRKYDSTDKEKKVNSIITSNISVVPATTTAANINNTTTTQNNNNNNKKQHNNNCNEIIMKNHNNNKRRKINTRRRKNLQNKIKKPLENYTSASRRSRRSRPLETSMKSNVTENKKMTATLATTSSSTTTIVSATPGNVPKRRGRSKKIIETNQVQEIRDNSPKKQQNVHNIKSSNLNDVQNIKGTDNNSQNITATLTTNQESGNSRQQSPSGRKLRRSERNSIPSDEIKTEEIEIPATSIVHIKSTNESSVNETNDAGTSTATTEPKVKRIRRSERLESRYEVTIEDAGNKIQVTSSSTPSGFQESVEIKEEPKKSPESCGGGTEEIIVLKDEDNNEKKPILPLIKMPISLAETIPKKRGRRTKIVTPEKTLNSEANALSISPATTPTSKKTRNSKETEKDTSILNSNIRKEKTNESSPTVATSTPTSTTSISQRPLRRIKPTVKILENEELRYEFETKNIARMTACSDMISTITCSPTMTISFSNAQVVETSPTTNSVNNITGNGKHKKDEVNTTKETLPKTSFSSSLSSSLSTSLKDISIKIPQSVNIPSLPLTPGTEDVKRKLFPPIENNLNVDNIYPASLHRPCPDPQTFLSEIKAAKINLHKSPENKKLNRKQHRKLLKQKEKHFEKLGLRKNLKDDRTETEDSSTDNEEFLPPKKLNVGKPNVTLRLRNKEEVCSVTNCVKQSQQQKLGQRKRVNSRLSSNGSERLQSHSSSLGKMISVTKESHPIIPIRKEIKKEQTMICLCQKPSHYYTRNTPETAFCCAIDSIEDEKVGCCNQLNGELLNLLRPSHRVGYMILCDDHKKRLLAHNCCASCGIFCTQGKFILCKQEHFFHAECAQKYILNTPYDPTNTMTTYPSPILVLKCPHCGCDTPEKTSLVTMKCNSLPVFLPSQRALIKPAKMTVPEGDLILSRTKRRFPSIIEMDKLIPESVISIALQRQTIETGGNASSNSTDESEFTSRDMFYAINHDDLERVAEIIASGYDITCEMPEFLNGTCLHLVAHFGTVQMAYLLLCRESSEHFLNMIDKELRTPAMCAVIGDKCDILKLFVQCGADLSLKGSDGMTCLHMAAKLGSIIATRLIIENYKNCTSIMNFDKFINLQDDGGWTAMVWAAENGFTDIVSYLISHGADTNVCDTENNTVLHWATLSNRIETIMVLLQANINCNQQNINGDTPLHIACRQSSTRICLMLIANGADLMVKNKALELPYDCIPNEESQCARAVGFNMQMRSFGPTGLKNKIICSDISNGRETHPIQAIRCDKIVNSRNNHDQDDDIMLPDFKYITKSILLQNSIQIDSRVSQMRICSCSDGCNTDQCQCSTISVQNWYTPEGRLNSEFCFEDPPMIFECNDVCGCNKLICKNRVVQNGIKIPLQIFECEQRLKGWGVRCLIQIPRGTFISEYTGEILTDLEADRRTDDSYFFDLGASDHCIDANYYGNISRFYNHSCTPNIVPVRVYYENQDYRFPKIAFFACKDIMAGEELCFDYGDKFWAVKQKYFSCQCKSINCRYCNTGNNSNSNINFSVNTINNDSNINGNIDSNIIININNSSNIIPVNG